jgi:hypothetical protein
VAVAGAGQQAPVPGVVAVLVFLALGKLRCQPVLVLLE